VKEDVRAVWMTIWVDHLLQDARFAVRMLAKHPVLTVAAVTALALGIGASASVGTVFNTVLLRPLPYPDADRLVRFIENVPPPSGAAPVRFPGLDLADAATLEGHATTLSHVVVFASTTMTLAESRNRPEWW
jgi:hypothetical protein